MSEMVERVAAAMIDRWKTLAHPASQPDLPYWNDMATAAVEAMREPTDDLERRVRQLEDVVRALAVGKTVGCDKDGRIIAAPFFLSK